MDACFGAETKKKAAGQQLLAKAGNPQKKDKKKEWMYLEIPYKSPIPPPKKKDAQ